jgi:transcriptional regulator with GAF, ATPase, and Fis domain
VTQVKLKRLLSKSKRTVSIINEIIDGSNSHIAIYDDENRHQLGMVDIEIGGKLDKHAIRSDSETIGWVIGDSQASFIADLLSLLSEKEVEKDDLLDEILNLYRQINMLFNLSDKLAASLELEAVANLALEEAYRLLDATGGSLIMVDIKGKERRAIATFGQGLHPQMIQNPSESIVGAVFAIEQAEIINNVSVDTRYVMEKDDFQALIYAPLKAKSKTIGGIVLVSEKPIRYSAADLNLLNTLASQAAPAIESALLHERVLREAREREERLQKQIQELSIELDEVRQREKVAEITETDYFQQLRDQATNLRKIIGSG